MNQTGIAPPTVMVVDDDAMVLSALRNFLELDTPYRVLACSNPLHALALLEFEPVSVIVSDFMMPGMDGVTFLQRSRDLRPFASRVLLTGYADKDNAVRAINEASLYHYLEKPWDNEVLKLTIRNGIERSTLFTELDMRISALESAHRELQGLRRRLAQAFL